MENFNEISLFDAALPTRSDAARAHVADIKTWLRTGLGLDDGTVVTVNEVACKAPRCPGFETIIAVLAEGQPARSFKIFLPILEISEARVSHAIAKENPLRSLS